MNQSVLWPLLKDVEICPWLLREASSTIDLFFILHPTGDFVFSIVLKTARGIWHGRWRFEMFITWLYWRRWMGKR
ncbi:hypothetical protein Lal_00044137 [Lupinus albus]|nr:hypothetical protein Lal_00044137 [Lupinus albus]